jgi:hypothetical protein
LPRMFELLGGIRETLVIYPKNRVSVIPLRSVPSRR